MKIINYGGFAMKIKIYTKTGDKGKTSLYDGSRIPKNDARVEAYGTIDELNSYIGVAKNFIDDENIFKILEVIQRTLFNVAGELATKDSSKFPEKITEDSIKSLENIIDDYLNKMNPDEDFKFILPGSSKDSAHLHVARTICRRAERRILTVAEKEEISPFLIKYVNRLSDVLYTLGRYLEKNITHIEFKKM